MHSVSTIFESNVDSPDSCNTSAYLGTQYYGRTGIEFGIDDYSIDSSSNMQGPSTHNELTHNTSDLEDIHCLFHGGKDTNSRWYHARSCHKSCHDTTAV